jgi:RimJ/RimL family protein N-acetyltransferase
MATTHADHLTTHLRSSKLPILLRNVEPRDAAAVAQLLSDPRNTDLDMSVKETSMSVETAAAVIGRMRESATVPTVVSSDDGAVISGPGRVNLLVVYLGPLAPGEPQGEQQEVKVIGLSGYGGIKTLEEELSSSSSASAVGPVGETRTKKITRIGDVGVMLDSEFRGRGFATEAIRLSVEWGFRSACEGGLQLDKVTATTLARNAAMVGLIEGKLGWKGTRRPLEKDGEVVEGLDEMIYDVYPGNWKKML